MMNKYKDILSLSLLDILNQSGQSNELNDYYKILAKKLLIEDLIDNGILEFSRDFEIYLNKAANSSVLDVDNVTLKYYNELKNKIQKYEEDLTNELGVHYAIDKVDITNYLDLLNTNIKYNLYYKKDISVNRIKRTFNTLIRRLNTSAEYESMNSSNLIQYKQWLTLADERVRKTHRVLHGRIIKKEHRFRVPKPTGGYDRMLYPRDINGSADNVENCRCFLNYHTSKIMANYHKKILDVYSGNSNFLVFAKIEENERIKRLESVALRRNENLKQVKASLFKFLGSGYSYFEPLLYVIDNKLIRIKNLYDKTIDIKELAFYTAPAEPKFWKWLKYKTIKLPKNGKTINKSKLETLECETLNILILNEKISLNEKKLIKFLEKNTYKNKYIPQIYRNTEDLNFILYLLEKYRHDKQIYINLAYIASCIACYLSKEITTGIFYFDRIKKTKNPSQFKKLYDAYKKLIHN